MIVTDGDMLQNVRYCEAGSQSPLQLHILLDLISTHAVPSSTYRITTSFICERPPGRLRYIPCLGTIYLKGHRTNAPCGQISLSLIPRPRGPPGIVDSEMHLHQGLVTLPLASTTGAVSLEKGNIMSKLSPASILPRQHVPGPFQIQYTEFFRA